MGSAVSVYGMARWRPPLVRRAVRWTGAAWTFWSKRPPAERDAAEEVFAPKPSAMLHAPCTGPACSELVRHACGFPNLAQQLCPCVHTAGTTCSEFISTRTGRRCAGLVLC